MSGIKGLLKWLQVVWIREQIFLCTFQCDRLHVYIGKREEIVLGDMDMEIVYFKTISRNCIPIEIINSTTENYSEFPATVSIIKPFETSPLRPSAANVSIIIFVTSVEV
jgi:hypothetical protein